MNMENKIKLVLDSLISGFEKEKMEDNAESFIKLQEIYEENPRRFLKSIEFAFNDFKFLVEKTINIPEQENMYILEFIVDGTYKRFYRDLMEKLEGGACCYDKASFITGKSLEALLLKENLSLYEDYSNTKEITENKDRQAYWSPLKIKDTDQAMEVFWDWYLLRDEVLNGISSLIEKA